MSSTDWESIHVNNCEDVDANIPTTLAECITPQLAQKLEACLLEVGQIWLEIGWPADLRDAKLQAIVKSLEDNIKDVATSQRKELTDGRNFRDFKLAQVNKILGDLTLEPFEVPNGLSIVAANQLLVKKFNELNVIKEERMKSFRTIEEKLTKVCHALGMEYIKPILATNIPNEAELQNREEKYISLDDELAERKKVYESLKSTINKVITQLEYQVTEKAEHMITDSNTSTFIFSTINMNVLKNFNQKILALHSQACQQMQEMSNKLHLLYIRLSVSESERNHFTRALDSCPTFPTKIRKLSEEIDKYEIIKKQSIEKITLSVRKDLKELFVKAYVQGFDESILTSEQFTEDLLDRHEAEYKQLKHYYEIYAEVFRKLERYKDLMEEKLDAEKQLADPNKYSNRGGTMLKSGTTVRRCTGRIAKLISDILNIVEINKGKQDMPFDAYGLDLNSYFGTCEMEYHKLLEEYKDSFKKPEAPTSKSAGSNSPMKFGSAKKVARPPLSPKIINRQVPAVGGLRFAAPGISKPKTITATTSSSSSSSSSSGRKRPHHLGEVDEQHFQRFINQKEMMHSTMVGPNEDEAHSITKRKRHI